MGIAWKLWLVLAIFEHVGSTFGHGTNLSRSRATGSRQLVGTTLVGNTDTQVAPGAAGQPRLVSIAAILASVMAAGSQVFVGSPGHGPPAKNGVCEKSPARSAAVGTFAGSEVNPCIVRRPSYDRKKKVLSFLIGPPKVPPN